MIKKTAISDKVTGDKLTASEFNELNSNFNSIAEQVSADYEILLNTEDEITNIGGTIVSGTAGAKQAVYKIPIELGGGGTVDFDFACDYDPHVAQAGEQTIFQIGTTYLKINPLDIVKGNFFPSFQSKWKSGGIGVAGTDLSITGWKNNFCGEDCFSIQKITNVVAGDDGLSVKVTDTAFIIYSGVTTIASYAFATYTTVDELIAAMQADAALSDFEIIAYESAGVNCADLAKVDMYIVMNRQDWDGATNAGLGTYSEDSWPVYIPKSGKSITHSCKMIFDGANNRVRIWVNGFPVREFTNAEVSTLNGDLYLGGNTSGLEVFDGTISNLRVRNTIEEAPVFTIIMGHLVGTGLDGDTVAGQRATIGRMERGIRAMKDRGYEFITQRKFIDYVLGNEIPPQKSAFIIYDDTNFGHWTTERIRSLYQKYGFCAATSIIVKNIDGSPGAYTEADVLKYINLTKQIGWDWLSHTYNHYNHDSLHFSQVKSDCDLVKAAIVADTLHTDALVSPQGSGQFYTRKYWNHTIYQVAFKYANGAGYYGGDVMALNRVYWDNSVDFADFLEIIDGKFPT